MRILRKSVKLRLRTKILLGFSSVVALLIASAGISALNSRKDGRTIEEINKNLLPDAFAFEELQLSTLKIQHWMSYAAATGDPSGSEKADESYQTASDILNKMIKEHRQASGKALTSRLEEVRDQLDEFAALGMQMVEAYMGSGKEIGNAMMERFNPAAETIASTMQELVKERNSMMQAAFLQILSSFRFEFILSVLIVVVCVSIAMFLAFALANSISRSVGRILDLTSGLHDGDLTRKVTSFSTDELGTLGRNLNDAVDSVRSLVESVKTTADRNQVNSRLLTEKSDSAQSASSRIAAATNDVRGRFSDFAHTVTRCASDMEGSFSDISNLTKQVESQASAAAETTAAVHQMTASLRNVDQTVKDKKKLSSLLFQITTEGVRKVDATNGSIRDISKSIETILELNKMIKDMSSQTNLLSMNASIEAAHAGSFGKGFAVVAGEIRKLAETTGKNAKDVSTSLNELVENINSALASSKESGAAFKEIHARVQEVVGALDEISENTIQSSAGSNQILKTMSALLAMTEEIKESTLRIEKNVGSIHKNLTFIKGESAKSLDNLQDIDTQTGLMKESVKEIYGLSEQGSADISKLHGEIGAFKTETS